MVRLIGDYQLNIYMRQLQLVGDVHGNFDLLRKIIYGFKGTTIQLGDLGVGFIKERVNPAWFLEVGQPYILKSLTNIQFNREQMVFLRGNHDSPEKCREHPNYLGEYGIYKNIFYISGAWSIDRDCRKEGVDWWADEELTIRQCYEALEMYKEAKPDIVISHDCPISILNRLHSRVIETRTGQLLDAVLREHKPKYWYFAHHHLSWQETINNTNFRCLNCNETVKI